MELDTRQDYQQLSDTIRGFVTQRYYELEKALRPWVDGSFGEIAPAPLAAYVTMLRDLAKLWQAHQRPDDEDRIPASQVQQLLEALEARMSQQQEEAVAAALEAQRQQLEAGERLELESAQRRVLERLGQVAAKRRG